MIIVDILHKTKLVYMEHIVINFAGDVLLAQAVKSYLTSLEVDPLSILKVKLMS